jgi:hypothetical protein
LPNDDGGKSKKSVLDELYTTNFIKFVLPHDQKWTAYYSRVRAEFPDIVPKSRGAIDSSLLTHAEKASNEDIKDFNVALGITGVFDRNLSQECARLEASLVRHSLRLRVLIIRYFKSLMIFVWTALIFFVLAPIITRLQAGAPIYLLGADLVKLDYAILATLFAVWAFGAPFVVRRLILWIWEEANKNTRPDLLNIDAHFVTFEKIVYFVCLAAIVSSSFGIVKGFEYAWGETAKLITKVILTVAVILYLYYGLRKIKAFW